ncbi:MAG: substrate-binding domain-containing protein [Planctomycetota bacterium]
MRPTGVSRAAPSLSHQEDSRGETRTQNVLVMVDTSSEDGRAIARGISSYAVKHGAWNLWIQSASTPAAASTIADLGGDGVIAAFGNALDVTAAVTSGIPCVNVGTRIPDSCNVPTVTSNDIRTSELALEHFRERGLQNLAYVGPLSSPTCRHHAASFQAAARLAGIDCDLFDCISETVPPSEWAIRREQLEGMLRKLDKPLGVFTFGAGSANQVLQVCRWNNIPVPDHVSILSGKDDELLCSALTPTISAIRTASEQIGYEAARQLDDLFSRKRPLSSEVTAVDPVLVSARQSTEAIAINDPDLLSAVRFIRENACGGINVQEVADSVPIGRRSLERKFKEHFGRTPLDEIQRLRLGRVRELLIKTDLPVSRIASDAGFGTPEYMTTMFKSRYGLTPLKFRSQTRAR